MSAIITIVYFLYKKILKMNYKTFLSFWTSFWFCFRVGSAALGGYINRLIVGYFIISALAIKQFTTQKWLVPSRPLASPPEARPRGSNWPPRPQGSPLLPLVNLWPFLFLLCRRFIVFMAPTILHTSFRLFLQGCYYDLEVVEWET